MKNEDNIEYIVKAIESIEKQLRDLKLEVLALREKEKSQEERPEYFQIGERVAIINPSFGQPNEGEIIRHNGDSGFYHILGRNKLGVSATVRRIGKNIKRLEE